MEADANMRELLGLTIFRKQKSAGMNEHLAKPFEMEKVLRTISRYHKV